MTQKVQQKLQSKSNCKFSIIIPTLNEEKYIENLLQSIKKQTLQPVEIIVADAGSKDKTREIAKKYGAKVVKGGLPAVGRNAGAKIAKGDILVFLDADAWLPKNTLESLCETFQKNYIELVIFKFRLVKFAFEKYGVIRQVFFKIGTSLDELYRKVEYKIGKLTVSSCGNIAVRREVYARVGGYNTALTLAEDKDFITRVYQTRPKKKQNYQFSDIVIKISGRRYSKPDVFLKGLIGLPFFLIADLILTLFPYKVKVKMRGKILSLFYGKLGGH